MGIKTILDNELQLEVSVAAFGARACNLKNKTASLSLVTNDICVLQGTTSELSQATTSLLTRIDDLEIHSRRCNLVIRGLTDVAGESWVPTQQKVTQFAFERLNIAILNFDIERAHRLGTYKQGRAKPIMVKTKTKLLLTSSKLKGTSFSLSDDYSPSLRFARKCLFQYGKEQSLPFKLQFDKLHIGDKIFVHDAGSSSVPKLTR